MSDLDLAPMRGGLRDSHKGHLAMLAFSALVAGSFSLGALIANEVTPAALNAVRFVLAGILIGAAAAIGPGLKSQHFSAPWRYALLGGVFATYFVLMFYGLKTADPVSAAAVFTLTPAMSGVFGWLLLRQITTPRMALALMIGGAGALWGILESSGGFLRGSEGRGGSYGNHGISEKGVSLELISQIENQNIINIEIGGAGVIAR